MSTITASPRTWTLRLKHHRTTVLIHVDPLQRWSLVRADLLRALHETHPNGRLGALTIPQSPQDVLLAKLVDPNDTTLGWVSLDIDSTDVAIAAADGVMGKGKGKAGAAASTPGKAKASSGKDAMRDCPQGAGLREGSVLAFKFREQKQEREDGEGVAGHATSATAGVEDDGDRSDGETLVGNLDLPEKWDVVMPSYEDTYDDDDEMVDEGVDVEG